LHQILQSISLIVNAENDTNKEMHMIAVKMVWVKSVKKFRVRYLDD
jgi:hypothetical protein